MKFAGAKNQINRLLWNCQMCKHEHNWFMVWHLIDEKYRHSTHMIWWWWVADFWSLPKSFAIQCLSFFFFYLSMQIQFDSVRIRERTLKQSNHPKCVITLKYFMILQASTWQTCVMCVIALWSSYTVIICTCTDSLFADILRISHKWESHLVG